MILTDANGVPIVKPEPPAPDANIETKVAYLMAHAAYNDKIAALASSAFDRQFRKSRKR